MCTQIYIFFLLLYYMANIFFFFLYIYRHTQTVTTDNKCLYLFRFEFFLFSLLLFSNWRNEKSKKEKYKKKVWEECEKIFFSLDFSHNTKSELDDLRFEMKLSTRQEKSFSFFSCVVKNFFLHRKIFLSFLSHARKIFSHQKKFHSRFLFKITPLSEIFKEMSWKELLIVRHLSDN